MQSPEPTELRRIDNISNGCVVNISDPTCSFVIIAAGNYRPIPEHIQGIPNLRAHVEMSSGQTGTQDIGLPSARPGKWMSDLNTVQRITGQITFKKFLQLLFCFT
jgi:hypothetical protein